MTDDPVLGPVHVIAVVDDRLLAKDDDGGIVPELKRTAYDLCVGVHTIRDG